MLLVLGVLEQIWPSKPRHPVRRPSAPPPSPPPPAPPAEPAMSPRLTSTLSPSRPPAETVFRRPAGYVEPPPADVDPPGRAEPAVPVEPVAHVPPDEPVEPPAPVEPRVPAEPSAPNEPPARPRLIVSAEILAPVEAAAPVEPEPPPTPASTPTFVVPPPPTNVVPLHERREPWSLPERRDIRPIKSPEPWRSGDFAGSVQPAEPGAPAVPGKEPDAPGLLARRRRSKISPHARRHRVLRPTAEAHVEPSASDVPKLGGGPIP